jgi:cytochrome o ubiquinol oxidase operon protein cyoD
MRKSLIRPENQGTLKFYMLGFILCILLTLAAYFLVTEKLLTSWSLISTILGLGFIQMTVQLIFFMHLAGENNPHWNLLVFFFMVMVLVIVVFGSMWIMYNVNYREMPPMDMSHAQASQEEK